MIRQKKNGGAFYYEFMAMGKRFNGVCEGCHTKRDAENYERNIRATAEKASAQRNVKALIENFRDELTGGHKVMLADAFDEYLKKPTKRIPGEDQTARNRTYWNDFVSFMAASYPDIDALANVTKRHAEEYISLIRTSGAFNKTVSFNRDGHAHAYTSKDTRLSPRTINARHKAIKAVFSRLADDAGISSNPFLIPTLDNETTSREAFTQDE